MRWTAWTRWIGRRSDDDFAAEVEAHIAMEEERLIRGGMTPDDARYAARRAFGNVTAPREHFHENRAGAGLESLVQDVRYGWRAMRRAPGFTAIAVLSLAIGIGANTTMFGAIDSLLVRAPAHVVDAERIHRVYFAMPDPTGDMKPWPYQSYGTYTSIRENAPGVESAAAFWTRKISSGRGAEARQVRAVAVTPSFFPLLGVRPAAGRFFLPTEERDDGDHVAVLGYEAWQGQYNGDPKVLGSTIDVGGVPYLIVGVTPRRFTGVNLDRVDLWLPLGVATRLLSPGVLQPRAGGSWLEIVVKRRRDATVARLNGEVTQLYRDLFRGSPRYATTFAKSNGMLGPVVAGRGPMPSADAKVSLWVAAVSVLVLLIASANVANLLLLRGLTRSREVALRLSLGASRWRVTRQWLVEGALLALLGAVCAIVLARWTSSAVLAFLLPDAVTDGMLSLRFFAFTTAIALGTGVLASIVPALVTARRDFGPLLGTGRSGASPHRLAVQRALIGVQVALAMLLLVGAGLFVTSLKNVRAIDLGVDAEHVLYVNLDFGGNQKVRDPNARASVNATYQAIVERLRRVPGVVNATYTYGEPLGGGSAMALRRRGGPELVAGSPVPSLRTVGPNYFETMGTPLVRGRYFTAADHVSGSHVAIVDEAAVTEFKLDGNGLDPCVYLGSDQTCTEIVGVVKTTVMWEITGHRASFVYMPFEAWDTWAASALEVRTAGDPAALIPALRQAVLSVSPDLPWAEIRPISEQIAPQLKPWRLGASMFTAFGVLALGLAAVGLYGLLSYMVTQRSHEIGVRKALGAPSGGVVAMVLRGALGMTAIGVMIGLGVALATGSLVASQLYGISPRDPRVMLLAASVLIVVTIVAAVAPARRATKVDPMVTLRSE